jgi:serine protease Do
MSSDGYIITNNHVIDSAENISITLMNGKTYDAKLVGRDKRSDLAVIKIEANDLIPAEFGDSDALKVGDLAVAIGNPLGLDLMGTVTDGIISAINRDVVVEERTMTLIQTNAAINSGNSGGPLINKYGQVIGINTLKMQDYYTNVEGLGFAIPTNTAKPIIDELIQYGYVKGRPSIGINVKTISESQARYFNVPQGVRVYYVHPEADAYKKGLQVNDIIVEAQGKEVKSASEINRIKEEYVAGDLFTVKVYRNGKYLEITFELMDEAVIDMSQGSFLVP